MRSTVLPRIMATEKRRLEIAESDHSLLRFYLPPEARWGVDQRSRSLRWPDDGETAQRTSAST